MRAWMWCGIALGAAASLTCGGCAAPPKRVEAPAEYRNWKPSAADVVAQGKADAAHTATKEPKDVFAIEPPPSFWTSATNSLTSMTTPKSTPTQTPTPTPTLATASTTRPSLWNYRPGSLFFNKTKPEPAPVPKVELGNTLSRYYPGLKGRDPGASLRMVRSDRPGRPAAGAPVIGSRTPVLAANAPLAAGSFQPTANTIVADNEPVSELPVGLKVETMPKAPSPTLPEVSNLAERDTPKPQPPVRSDEQLTSLETEIPPSVKSQEQAKDLSLDLQIEPSATKSDPQPAPATLPPPSLNTLVPPDLAPVDTASKPASATVTTPAPEPSVAPASDEPPPVTIAPSNTTSKPAETAASNEPAPPAATATLIAPATMKPAVIPELEAAEPVASHDVVTASPSSPPIPATVLASPGGANTPTNPLDTDPVLKGRPRYGNVRPMDLPPAEFPRTYHEQSIQRVLDINIPDDPTTQRAMINTAANPRRTFFPRLSKLLKPKAADDHEVKRASTLGEVKASTAKSPSKTSSTVAKPVQVPDW